MANKVKLSVVYSRGNDIQSESAAMELIMILDKADNSLNLLVDMQSGEELHSSDITNFISHMKNINDSEIAECEIYTVGFVPEWFEFEYLLDSLMTVFIDMKIDIKFKDIKVTAISSRVKDDYVIDKYGSFCRNHNQSKLKSIYDRMIVFLYFNFPFPKGNAYSDKYCNLINIYYNPDVSEEHQIAQLFK